MPVVRLPRGARHLPARLKVIASVVVVTLGATSLLVFAYLSQGYPAQRVDLNDAGVWVTNDSDGLFGRLNKSAASLDAYFNPHGGVQSAYTLDVAQDRGAVLAWDRAEGKVTPVDVAAASLVTDSAVPLPSATVLDMRGGTVAALDPQTGRIWATRYAVDSPTTLNLSALAEPSKPLAQISAPKQGQALKEGARFSALVVDAEGGVHAADITGKTVTVAASGSGFDKPVVASGAQRESVDLTAVGNHVVYLDVVAGTLSVNDQQPVKRSELVAGARAQQAGQDADEVLVATPTGLFAFSATTPEASPRIISQDGAGIPAAPVQVRGCAYGAWSGSPGVVVKGCGAEPAFPLNVKNAGQVLSRPVFRVNRSQVVVNDAADGQVYDLDSLQRVDNWDKVQDAATDETVVDDQLVQQEKEKPKANKDNLGARPGRTTMLYVLDNDTDKGGRILSISDVTQPGNENAKVSIAPDGQALILTLSEKGGAADFTYQLSNGLATAKGDVHVEDKGLVDNTAPQLKQGASAPPLTVASSGTLPIQVLDQWRDPEGDPVGLAGATVTAGTTNLTADGRIELTAAATVEATDVKVTYAVSDGRSEPVKEDLAVRVLSSKELKSTPVGTQPDVARGEVGRPIIVRPLLNDVPGADPLNPKATMRLAGPITEANGLKIQTDEVSGQVSVTSKRPGPFFLEYGAAFGSAEVAKGKMRIDVDPAKEDRRSPVAVPDKAVVRGTGSVLVDVLANDSDPLGSILTVQSAAAAESSQVNVAVVSGRWLKLTPSSAALPENPTFVTYRISNGVAAPVEGVVAVTQLDPPRPDQILTRPDYATVRTGDSTTIRVLENDAALSGATLSLLGNVSEADVPGQLQVFDPGEVDAGAGDNGSAYVSGDVVRFVAPQGVRADRKLTVNYVAMTEAGETKGGTIEVTIKPEPSAKLTNLSPTPRPVEVRAVSGETVVVPIDPSNGDPDGDSTAVTGIASAPAFGRVLGVSPTGITYQAYPDSAVQGTDSFSYVVTDRFGATGTSTIRVGITAPALPQEAVPAPLSMTAEPGAAVTLYPLVSAAYGKTDPVRVLPLDQFEKDLPEGTLLHEETQSIRSVVGSAEALPVKFSYRLSGNAGESAPAPVTLWAKEGFKNPPRLQDATVKPDGSGRSTVDVLATAFDPDGDSSRLTVTKVGAGAQVNGGRVTVPVLAQIQAIPFEVTDESGATSTAVIRVPAEGAGGPYVLEGKTIQVPQGEAVTVELSDHVADPQGKPVMLTLTELLDASPEGKVTASATSGTKGTQLTVTGAAGYIGPGAVVAEVTNGTSIDDPEGIRTFVSIPVQVGPETPVLRCPTDVIPIYRGGKDVSRDITSLCSVWSPTKEMAESLTFEGSWTKPLDAVSVSNGRSLVISASSDASPGSSGVLAVTASGTEAAPSALNVKVLESPRATLSPITLPEMKAGEAREVDLTPYFRSPLKDPKPQALSIKQSVGMAAAAEVKGMTARITPSAASHGRMEFVVTMTDVTEKDATDRARRVTGTIGFDVFTKPDAPGRPQPQAALASRSATVSWAAPPSNGAPILEYEVSWGSGTQKCSSSPCTITGLTNGQDYTFRVRARNKADWSAFSQPSVVNRPNAKPLAVVATQTAAVDGAVTLSWAGAQGDGSPIEHYWIVVDGRKIDAGRGLSHRVTGLANGPGYTFTLVAENNSTLGPSSTVQGFAAGTPRLGGPVTPTQAAPADSDVTTVTITANGAEQNGPEAVVYSFLRDGAPLASCTAISSNVCVDQGVRTGVTYTYSAAVSTTFLGVTRASAPVAAAGFSPFNEPGPWATPVARAANLNNQVTLTYTVPPSRGTTSVVSADLGSGWVSVPSPGPQGGAGTATLAGRQGGGEAKLRVCNQRDACRTSALVPYNAYADMGGLGFTTQSINGPTVCVGAQGNGNGWGATLRISGPGVDNSTSSSGGMSLGPFCPNVGYGQSVTYTATLTDAPHVNGEPGRSTKTVSWQATTNPPPPPPGPTSSITRVGNSVRLDYTNLTTRSWALRCWQISDPAQHNWSTNFLGEVNRTFGGSGSVTINCPIAPTAGQPFMLEVWEYKYVGPITW